MSTAISNGLFGGQAKHLAPIQEELLIEEFHWLWHLDRKVREWEIVIHIAPYSQECSPFGNLLDR